MTWLCVMLFSFLTPTIYPSGLALIQFMQYWNLVQFQLWHFHTWKLSVKMRRVPSSYTRVSVNAELGDLFTKCHSRHFFLSKPLLAVTRDGGQGWRGEIQIFSSFLKLWVSEFGYEGTNHREGQVKVFGKGGASKTFCIMEETCYHNTW